MQNQINHEDGFIPLFKRSFLRPRYWGIWLGLAVLLAISFIPAKWRNPALGALGRQVGRYARSARRRAQINLLYCMPELNDQQREQLVDKMFATAMQSALLLVEQSVRNPKYFSKHIRWHGKEHIEAVRANNDNVIMMVPHGWCIDILAMLLAAEGNKVAAMFHHQSNPLVDWLWNKVRLRFGGRLHARKDGVKPFIHSVRQGYWGYYLPDQDHGAEQSVFVDFFATYKATLPALGRIMKVSRAKVLPVFPVYHADEGVLDIFIRPPLDDIEDAEPEVIARRMNEEIEILVKPNPEQYTWLLKLLKTRKEGETEPYIRKELWPGKKDNV